MKNVLLVIMLMIASLTHAQWNYDRIVDESNDYVIAYNKDQESGYLKMEVSNNKIILYIQDNFYEDDAYVSAIFATPQGNYEVKFHGVTKNNGDLLLLETDLANAYYLNYFKQATQLVFKIQFDNYVDSYYAFNMRYSTAAFNYLYNNRFL